MRTSPKYALGILAAASIALLTAGAALAGLSPKFTVATTAGATGKVTVGIGDLNPADDALGEIKVVVPTGYTFAAQSSVTGAASGSVIWVQQDPTTPLAMTGGLSPVSLTDSRLSTTATGCDTSATHQFAWIGSLTGGGDTITFPVFLDTPTGADASLGAYELVACFPPIAQGSKFVSATLAVPGLVAPTAAGTYMWHELLVPFNTDGTTLNTAGSVSAQNTQTLQTSSLSVAGKLAKKVVKHKTVRRVTLSGTLTVGGKPAANTIVAISHGSVASKLVGLGSVKTNASGRWTKTITLTKGAEFFQAGSTVKVAAGACQAVFTGVPCVTATGGATAVTTRIVRFAA